VLEERIIVRVGGRESLPINVRIVAAHTAISLRSSSIS